MENNKVRRFVDLLLEGENIDDAVKESDIGDMKLLDVLKVISKTEYIESMSKMVEVSKEAIQQVKDLDGSLEDLDK